ncbi:MAG: prolyl oligopeptidase family serine peptidase [Chitinispirillaceae bacterium]|nr:prolyl oligopeptidase family serine peptidase [Chitinispirillaceae bacterium]
MNSLLFRLLFLGILGIPAAYLFRGHYHKAVNRVLTKSFTFQSNTCGNSLRYRLFTPKTKHTIKYPLILTLHSAAERGKDNIRQIDGVASIFISGKTQRKHPAFVFIPQCPEGTQWVNTGFTKTPFTHYNHKSIDISNEFNMIIKVIKQLISSYPIDTTRIYVGGFSMGGSGTWDIITRYPQLFAAAFVMAGVSDTAAAQLLTKIPIWAFNGSLDKIAPPGLNTEMCNAVNRAGGTCKLTVYDEVGHYCVHHAMKEPGFIEWLFSQQRYYAK